MKRAFILMTTLLATSAHAGLLDALIGGPPQPPSLFPPEMAISIRKNAIPEVPVKADCQPSFVPGNDGIFRRTDYCHKTNPTEPRDFLKLGYDVPATFLTGFTADDVFTRWQGAQFSAPVIMGTTFEVPAEMLKRLNVDAAETWALMVQCAEQDADRAREMYRRGSFDCADGATIRSKIVELRENLPRLAASLELAPFLDGDVIEKKLQELRAKEYQLYIDYSGGDREKLWRERDKIWKEDDEVRRLRDQISEAGLLEFLNKTLPRLPRIHPLFSQMMVEEFLSLLKPDEGGWWVARKLERNRARLVYLYQISLWGNAIEDRGCAALGLWPSANRVAIDTLGDRLLEIGAIGGGPKGKRTRLWNVVDCPKGRSVMPANNRRHEPFPEEMMRMDQIYTEGRETIWRELREVRERYVSNGKN